MTPTPTDCEPLKALVRTVPDFPKPGILFYDITTLLKDPKGFAALIDALAQYYIDKDIDLVLGIEARGFILAAPVALELGAGFVPVRKQGKLPAPAYAQSYELEYGTATLEVHTDAFDASDRVLIVDDVLATGGTAAATVELVRQTGATIVGLVVLLELEFLAGREKLPGIPVRSLLPV